MAFRNIYTFGPTFRAENSNTTRHAAEFWMIEPEIAFADLQDDMDTGREHDEVCDRLCAGACTGGNEVLQSVCGQGALERLEHVRTSDFGRVTYTEAIELLEKHNDEFDYKVQLGLRPSDRA